jgi:hypothetical protein
VAEGQIGPDRERQLARVEKASQTILGKTLCDPVLGLLLEQVPVGLMNQVLLERFEDNLCRFLGSVSAPRFESAAVLWFENVHMEDDALPLIERCGKRWDLGASLDLQGKVTAGSDQAADAVQASIQRLVPEEGMKVHGLIGLVPLEYCEARITVSQMIASGALVLKARKTYARRLDATIQAASDGFDDGAWNDQADDFSDDDLDAFGGADDERRGGENGGQFLTNERHLERVDIGNVSPDTTPSIPRTALDLGSSTLSDHEALTKLGVVDQVFGVLFSAFEQEGINGKALLEGILDQCPARYVHLFSRVRVNPDGTLQRAVLIRNLRRRPDLEHRRLLNQGLLDLLDRAMGRAADKVSSATVDRILEQVADYRQRLGL